jgi:hypothetical protein
MRPLFWLAIMAFGITGAHAQTASTTVGVGSDPLSVPTQSLPSGFSLSTGFGAFGNASGSFSATGTAAIGGVGGSSRAGASGISASSSNTSQVPLQLPGEMLNTSTQSATSTAAAASHAASPICPPPVPTSDGGSANLTEMVGGSLSGC